MSISPDEIAGISMAWVSTFVAAVMEVWREVFPSSCDSVLSL
jgi:hypothetical protein